MTSAIISGAITSERYEKVNGRLAEVKKSIETRNAKRQEMERFIWMLEKRENLLIDFDDELWLATVHQLKVHSEKEFAFVLKDGTEMAWIL